MSTKSFKCFSDSEFTWNSFDIKSSENGLDFVSLILLMSWFPGEEEIFSWIEA